MTTDKKLFYVSKHTLEVVMKNHVHYISKKKGNTACFIVS